MHKLGGSLTQSSLLHIKNYERLGNGRKSDSTGRIRQRPNQPNSRSGFVWQEILWTDAAFDFDPTKLTVHVRKLGITGYEAEEWLRKHFNIEVELSDLYSILCLVTPGDSRETVDCLLDALSELAKAHQKPKAEAEAMDVELPEIPMLALTPRDAFYGEVELSVKHQGHYRNEGD